MVAIYARQSVDKKDSISIEMQIEFAKKEITDMEYRVYQDKGYSGGNINRPEFEKMITDIKNGKINKVIVYKLDRISRSLLDFANIIELFEKHDIEFISATEKFDTSTPIGKAMLNIIMVFAQLERETIQKRIKDNYYSRGKKGFFLGGKTPYGYKKDKITIDGKKVSVLTKNNKEIDTLKNIFDLYAHNPSMSLGKISRYLNKKNIPAPRGGSWESTKIQRILRNPVYVKADADVYMYFKNKECVVSNNISEFTGVNACYLFGKRDRNAGKYTNVQKHILAIALHEGVIDSYTWLKCQHKLDKNKQIKNSGKGKHSWLSGLTKCGYCGYAMTVKTYKQYKYFNCIGRQMYKVCNTKQTTHYVEDIENVVQERLIKRIKDMNISNLNEKQKENNQINTLKLQILEIETQIDNLINQIATSNNIVIEYINKKITELDENKKELTKKIEQISTDDTKVDVEFLKTEIEKWDKINLENKKIIAQQVIDKILITNDTIDIVWKV